MGCLWSSMMVNRNDDLVDSEMAFHYCTGELTLSFTVAVLVSLKYLLGFTLLLSLTVKYCKPYCLVFSVCSLLVSSYSMALILHGDSFQVNLASVDPA